MDATTENVTHMTEVVDEIPNTFGDVCQEKLELLHSTVNFYVPKSPHKPYFMLVNPERKDRPLRLYRSAMMKLVEHLPKAIEKVNQIRRDYPGDDVLYEIAVINQKNYNYVRLVVQTYSNEGYIYVRMFNKTDGTMVPTKYGIRIMYEDDLVKFNNFVAKCK